MCFNSAHVLIRPIAKSFLPPTCCPPGGTSAVGDRMATTARDSRHTLTRFRRSWLLFQTVEVHLRPSMRREHKNSFPSHSQTLRTQDLSGRYENEKEHNIYSYCCGPFVFKLYCICSLLMHLNKEVEWEPREFFCIHCSRRGKECFLSGNNMTKLFTYDYFHWGELLMPS